MTTSPVPSVLGDEGDYIISIVCFGEEGDYITSSIKVSLKTVTASTVL
jgi:hypothetical protein